MTKKNKNKWWLNGGRESGRTFRLLCETYENKIADIKANCDLAIEGRDIKIMELEQQIEKMKCCENCKHKKSEVDRCELLMYTMNACLCKNKDKWELKND